MLQCQIPLWLQRTSVPVPVPVSGVCLPPARPALPPAPKNTQAETLFKGHLLESETYIGGKVEALESGVFRSDLPTRFKCKAAAYQGLIDVLDRDLSYAITHEGGWDMADVANYEEVKAEITAMLEALRDAPNRWGQGSSEALARQFFAASSQ